MVDRDVCDGLGFRETQVHRNATAPLLVLVLRAPEGDAAAHGTEMEIDRFTSNVGLRPGRDPDPPILVVIRPERPVASTDRAVAGGGSVGFLRRAAIELRHSGRHLRSSRSWDPRLPHARVDRVSQSGR